MTVLSVLGDSIAAGRYASNEATENFAVLLGARLGWTVVNAGVPGTGYWASWAGGDPGWMNGPYGSYGARLAADVLAHSPDVVLVQGSSNDVGVAPAVVAGAAAALYDAILDALPSVRLIVTFPLFWQRVPMLKTVASYDEMRPYIRAALPAGAIWIDPIADNWITGSGTTSTPAGDGNADVYLEGGGAHPNTAGHAYIAARLAHAISPPATGLGYL